MSTEPKKLYRSHDKMLSGVCGGVAEYFNVDPTLIRLGYVAVCLLTGLLPCLLAYAVALFVVPEKPYQ